MPRADKCLCVTGETKELVKEDKPEGWTFDYWVRRKLGVADE